MDKDFVVEELDNLKICQSSQLYRFTCDAVFLANFCHIAKNDLCMEFCAGSGVISLILCQKASGAVFHLVEIQEEMANLCSHNITMNKLGDRLLLHNCDIKTVHKTLLNKFDVIFCNPPYYKLNEEFSSTNQIIKNAKFENLITLDEIIVAAKCNIKTKGRFYMVHRADRVGEIVFSLYKNNFALKSMQFIQASSDKNAHLVLVEALFEGRCQVSVLPPLIIDEKTDCKPTLLV